MPLCGFLKLSTAVDVLLGPFIDDTDGKSAETGLSPDVEISKNGQALADKNDVTVPTHDSAGTVDGYYNCELDATDTGTLGIITLVAHTAGFLPVRQDYQIIPATAYDALYATLENQTRIIQILTGKWEVIGNQLKMYDSDGTTVLYTFNLTQDGVPTEFNPDVRSPV